METAPEAIARFAREQGREGNREPACCQIMMIMVSICCKNYNKDSRYKGLKAVGIEEPEYVYVYVPVFVHARVSQLACSFIIQRNSEQSTYPRQPEATT